MKLNLKYIIAVSVLVGMTGCDDKIEPFETAGLYANSCSYQCFYCSVRSAARGR